MARKQTKDNSSAAVIACRGCKTRYNTESMVPGSAFSCRSCGEVLFVPGEETGESPDITDLPFGQMAVQMGFISSAQLTGALKKQRTAADKTRIGDILVKHNLLDSRQVSQVLHAQGSRIAHLIPGYRIVDKLGEGGMGAVYKGVHLASRKTVAMKVLSDKLARRPEFLERFHREARVAIDLDHPNIVKGFDVGAAGETHYFVMEYVHGKSTARVLRKRGRFSERRAMDIVRQIAKALQYAHDRNIVHRDIKPDNIMITRDGKVKLADYGLVKLIDDLDAGLTTEGQVMGTPNYISPEQASGNKVIDIRSDIYSLGATAFNLLCGRPPYEGRSVAIIMGMHVSSPVPDPREANEELSDPAAEIIRTMLAKDPADRYQTPDALLEALEAFFQKRTPTRGGLTPSGSVTAGASFWDTDGGATEESDEDLLADEGEGERHLSRTGLLLFGTGIRVLAVGVLVAFLQVWYGEDDRKRPELGPDDSGVGPVGPSQRDSVSARETEAAALYKEAVVLEGKERIRMMRQIVRDYPKTATAVLARREVTANDRRRAAEARARAEEKRKAREAAAMQAYEAAMTKSGGAPRDFAHALQAVIDTHTGTRGAESAARRLARLRKRMEEAATTPGSDHPDAEDLEQKRKEAVARLKFLDVYKRDFRALDLANAKKWARLMLEDERYPGLHSLAGHCLADVEDLDFFFSTIRAALLETGDEPQTLTFGEGEKRREFEVIVKNVEDNTIHLILGERLPMKRPITELNSETLRDLFRRSYKRKTPPPEVLFGLYHYALGETDEAARLFEAAGRRDPRRVHHAEMLLWD